MVQCREDPDHAQGGSQNNKDAIAMNDVGWDIFPGNYERYITQWEPNNTSVGWWRVGSINEPYGRFARGFNKINKKTMYFDINDDFISTCPKSANGGCKVKIHIVYYDIGNGTWNVQYDAINSQAPLVAKTQTNSNPSNPTWKEVTITINDGEFRNHCANDTDILISYTNLASTGQADPIFHLIEVTKNPPPP